MMKHINSKRFVESLAKELRNLCKTETKKEDMQEVKIDNKLSRKFEDKFEVLSKQLTKLRKSYKSEKAKDKLDEAIGNLENATIQFAGSVVMEEEGQ